MQDRFFKWREACRKEEGCANCWRNNRDIWRRKRANPPKGLPGKYLCCESHETEEDHQIPMTKLALLTRPLGLRRVEYSHMLSRVFHWAAIITKFFFEGVFTPSFSLSIFSSLSWTDFDWWWCFPYGFFETFSSTYIIIPAWRTKKKYYCHSQWLSFIFNHEK